MLKLRSFKKQEERWVEDLKREAMNSLVGWKEKRMMGRGTYAKDGAWKRY